MVKTDTATATSVLILEQYHRQYQQLQLLYVAGSSVAYEN